MERRSRLGVGGSARGGTEGADQSGLGANAVNFGASTQTATPAPHSNLTAPHAAEEQSPPMSLVVLLKCVCQTWDTQLPAGGRTIVTASLGTHTSTPGSRLLQKRPAWLWSMFQQRLLVS